MRSSEQAFRLCALVGTAGVLIGASTVSAQEGGIALGEALRKLSEDQAARQSAPPLVSPAGPSPSNRVADTDRFVLLGVVISDSRRLALLQPATQPGAGSLVRLGDSFEDHRLIDVQTDHVTIEARSGERFLVKLASGRAGVPAATTPAAPVASPSTRTNDRIRAEKDARQRQKEEATARDKARGLAERFQLGTMPPDSPIR